jgi:hypothetical protein
MDKIQLKALCHLLMCDDPSVLDDEHRSAIEEYAETQSVIHGYSDWIDAYHRL